MASALAASERKRKRKAAFQRKGSNRATIIDTLDQCARDPVLRKTTRAHICLLRGDVERTNEREDRADAACSHVEVRDCDCVAMAKDLCKLPNAKVWILNMASARRPGGGIFAGCNAQEEHLCRCSNLFPHLKRSADEGKYPLHRYHSGLTSGCW